jgi:hypothetical protein
VTRSYFELEESGVWVETGIYGDPDDEAALEALLGPAGASWLGPIGKAGGPAIGGPAGLGIHGAYELLRRQVNGLTEIVDGAFIGRFSTSYGGNVAILNRTLSRSLIGQALSNPDDADPIPSALTLIQSVHGTERSVELNRPAFTIERAIYGDVTAPTTMLAFRKRFGNGASDDGPYMGDDRTERWFVLGDGTYFTRGGLFSLGDDAHAILRGGNMIVEYGGVVAALGPGTTADSSSGEAIALAHVGGGFAQIGDYFGNSTYLTLTGATSAFDAYRHVGEVFEFDAVSAQPAVLDGTTWGLWVDSDDDTLYFWDGTTNHDLLAGGGGGVTDHGALTGLLDDDHTQYALLAGRAGSSQVLNGSPTSGNDLILRGNSAFDGTGAVRAQIVSTDTTTDHVAARVEHILNGVSPAAGAGVSLGARIQSSSDVARLGFVYTDVTAASEDVKAVLKLMRAGALTTAFEVNSLGRFNNLLTEGYVEIAESGTPADPGAGYIRLFGGSNEELFFRSDNNTRRLIATDNPTAGEDGLILAYDFTNDTYTYVSPTTASLPFQDNVAFLQNAADGTKQARFDLSGLTTATTRVYDLPDEDGTLALVGFSTFTDAASGSSRSRTIPADTLTATGDCLWLWCAKDDGGNFTLEIDGQDMLDVQTGAFLGALYSGVLFGVLTRTGATTGTFSWMHAVSGEGGAGESGNAGPRVELTGLDWSADQVVVASKTSGDVYTLRIFEGGGSGGGGGAGGIASDEGVQPLWTPIPRVNLSARSAGEVALSGSDVTDWNSFGLGASNNLTFTQSTSGARPDYISTDGAWGVDFDGTDDYLTNTTAGGILSGTLGEVWAVVTIDSDVASSPGAAGVVLASCDAASSNRFLLMNIVSVAGSQRINLSQQNADTADAVRGDTDITLGEPHLLQWSSNGSTWNLYVDGVLQTLTATSGSNTGDWFGDTAARDNLTLGALVNSSFASGRQFLPGKIHELIAWDGQTLSREQFVALGNRLAAKWGFTYAGTY